MKIKDLILKATNILKENDIESYNLDSRLLLAHVLGKDKLYILVNIDEEVSLEEEKKFFDLVEMRRENMPMQYILGHVEFMGMEFIVKEGVLVPRGDTEILVEEVLENIDEKEDIDVIDLCCGSGAIGLALAHFRSNIHVDLVDLYPVPEEVTNINMKRFELESRTSFIKSDLLEEIKIQGKKYDILVSNPPYIQDEEVGRLMDDVKNYEPHTALCGGKDGLDFYRRIIIDAPSVLKGKKILAFEIGYDEGIQVKTLMENVGFKNVIVKKDLAGLDRVVIGALDS